MRIGDELQRPVMVLVKRNTCEGCSLDHFVGRANKLDDGTDGSGGDLLSKEFSRALGCLRPANLLGDEP